MKSRSVRLVLVVPFCFVAAQAAFGSVPGSMEITCDVDRKAFRTFAKNETQVTFRLWDSQTGGSQCGSDHVVLMKDLVVFKERTDRFDAQRPRRFATVRAALGSDASPVQLCSGAETWLDVTVGTTTLTCDFSADDDANNPPPPPTRKRLHSVPSAQTAQPADISVRATHSVGQSIPDDVSPGAGIALALDSERWDTDSIHDTVANNSRLTAQRAGKYLIFGSVWFQPDPDGDRYISIRLNGSTIIADVIVRAAQTLPTAAVISTHYSLLANDYVELVVAQNSGGPLNVEGGPGSAQYSPEFGMVKLP